MRYILLLVAIIATLARPTFADVPDSLEVTCDTDRKLFRTQAKDASAVTFTLWPAPTGGSPCGTHTVPMSALAVFKAKTDGYDDQKPRNFAQIRAVLGTAGSSGTPVNLCAGGTTWIDIAIGANPALPCDFNANPTQPRRRLPSVAYALECGACNAEPAVDVSGRASSSPSFLTMSGVSTPITTFTQVVVSGGVAYASGTFTVPTTANYFIHGQAAWDANGTGGRSLRIVVNGVSVASSVGVPGSSAPSANDQAVSTHYPLSAGDSIQLVAQQTSGSPLAIGGAAFGLVKMP